MVEDAPIHAPLFNFNRKRISFSSSFVCLDVQFVGLTYHPSPKGEGFTDPLSGTLKQASVTSIQVGHRKFYKRT